MFPTNLHEQIMFIEYSIIFILKHGIQKYNSQVLDDKDSKPEEEQVQQEKPLDLPRTWQDSLEDAFEMISIKYSAAHLESVLNLSNRKTTSNKATQLFQKYGRKTPSRTIKETKRLVTRTFGNLIKALNLNIDLLHSHETRQFISRKSSQACVLN